MMEKILLLVSFSFGEPKKATWLSAWFCHIKTISKWHQFGQAKPEK
jgi:hypothetical protein